MGKWDSLRDKLELLPMANETEGSEWWGRVVARMEELKKLDKGDVGRGLAEVRYSIDKLEEELSKLKLEKVAHEGVLAEHLDSTDEQSFKLRTGEGFRLQYEPYASVTDRAQVREWAINNGYFESLQIPWQTLNSVCKEKLEAGEEAPEGVKLFLKRKIVFTRPK